VTIKPKSTKLGQPITLIAAVKNLSRPRVEPIGSVTFVEGTTVIGTGILVGGKARLTTSGLPIGRDLIRVSYGGTAYFAGGASPGVVESVSRHHYRKALARQLNECPGGGSGYVRHTLVPRRHAAMLAFAETRRFAPVEFEP
jgi:Bacterial Ig-like domain (group 3)